MNFNKPMIDLVREIRRRAPSDLKPGIKLANSALLLELIPWCHNTKDAVVKALIKELFSLAGEEWQQKLDQFSMLPDRSSEKKFITKVYRGQTQLVEVPTESESSETAPERIYRGQIVR